MADIAASVLAKLKNKAKASGISYQQETTMMPRKSLTGTTRPAIWFP